MLGSSIDEDEASLPGGVPRELVFRDDEARRLYDDYEEWHKKRTVSDYDMRQAVAHFRNFQVRSNRKDEFIDFIKAMLAPAFSLHMMERAPYIMAKIERLIERHRRGESRRLYKLVPTVGRFFTPLPLERAWVEYDNATRISDRTLVGISSSEIRHVLNLAQVIASTSEETRLRLVTFDGDKTLYEDGADFQAGSKLVVRLIKLLRQGLNICVVTAAGYPGKPEMYEKRLEGLLQGFEVAHLDADTAGRLMVLGGESNFLFRCEPVGEPGAEKYRFVEVPTDEWATPAQRWCWREAKRVLDIAQESMEDTVAKLHMQDTVILRKDLAVGLIKSEEARAKNKKLPREALDEVVLRVQSHLQEAQLSGMPIGPHCAFNGGQDAWVDVGNKYCGLLTLQSFLSIAPEQCLHVGDQFTQVGNDFATREAVPTIWVHTPEETGRVIKELVARTRKPSA